MTQVVDERTTQVERPAAPAPVPPPVPVRTVGPRVTLVVVISLAFLATFTVAAIRLSGLQG